MSVVALVSGCVASATGGDAARIEGLLGRIDAGALTGDAERLVEGLVSAIDAELAAQLDLVLAHPKLRRLEAAWRGLHEVVMRLPRDRELRVEILNCSLGDLEADFEDAPDILKSGLFKLVYSAEYGPFGGRPYAAVVCHEPFEPDDLRLLRSCAQVARLAALQFVGQAGERLVRAAQEPEEEYLLSRWARFRHDDEARFVSLVAGRWLARRPLRRDPGAARPWPYHEGDAALREASGALLVALSLARSFAAHRSPIHAFGETDGRFEDLPHHAGLTTCGAAPPEHAARLDDCGFLPLVQRGPGVVEIAGDTTCHRGARRAGRDLDDPRLLEARLPATLFAQRFVHYFKVLHREQVGTWRTREETERALTDWLETYVCERFTSPAFEGRDEVERGFVARLHRSPEDLVGLGEYAGWLEAAGHAAQARFVRDEVALRMDFRKRGSRTGHGEQDPAVIPRELERLVSRGRYSRSLRGFRLELTEPAGVASHWPMRLELELDRWRGGKGCTIGITARIDRE